MRILTTRLTTTCLIAVSVLSLYAGDVSAQKTTVIKELKIGDIVPDIEFKMLNYKTPTAKLSDFKGKLVILDFWGTWCTACIKKFPLLDSLQKKNKDILQVVLVHVGNAKNTGSKLDAFFDTYKRRNGNNLGLPTAINDTIAAVHFPFSIIPHVVWIDKEGVLRAVTDGVEMNEDLVKAVYKGKRVNLQTKNDYTNYDYAVPLFQAQNGGEERNVKFKSMITGYLDGIPQTQHFDIDSVNQVTRYQLTNYSALQIYQYAYKFFQPFNRFVLNVKNKERFLIDYDNKEWLQNNRYCYEIISPMTTKDMVLEQMKKDLFFYFGVNSQIKKMPMKCLVIKELDDDRKRFFAEDHKAEEGKEYINTIGNLEIVVNQYAPIPILRSSEIAAWSTIRIERKKWDLDELRAELNKNGYDLKEEQRELEAFVLSDGSTENEGSAISRR
jgi:thiol-disulfide isomerase/thioredoxin